MDHSPPPKAEPERAPVADPPDRLAVAFANASLLGIGYLMLGRRALALVTGLVTVVLVVLLAAVARSVWFEVVVLVWWVALVAHGWYLAGRPSQSTGVRRQRLVALGVTVPVLLAVGLLRLDASGIERSVTEARRSGDCAQALTSLDRVWLGHRMADAPMTARGERTERACHLLQTADDRLTSALNGEVAALQAGFDGLTEVLTDLPGHEPMVDVILNGFLDGLPMPNDPCRTAALTDWLRQRAETHPALDRTADAVTRTAPAALVGCGENRMADSDWEQARGRYQQLLDQYPGHELTVVAREGVTQATLAIELANVRTLLEDPVGLAPPAYCSAPARYSGAAPYGPGTNRALILGGNEHTSRLPVEWRTGEATDAVLVLCVGEDAFGAPVATCQYEGPLEGYPVDVTFHRIAIPVRAYELRTGNVVADIRVEIDGGSCPDPLPYTYRIVDLGPPRDVYVSASDADVRGAFESLITR